MRGGEDWGYSITNRYHITDHDFALPW
eukprot:SAG31_NODE_703_length_12720_cov_10.185088_17_plen_26_part_01